MPITVMVSPSPGDDARLTFDGTQRVVIGRGAGSDVRIPDATVSHRHATIRSQGVEFAVVDEGSTNGTFVGSVRVAPNTSRLLRSGDVVRVGRVRLQVLFDHRPVTRDVALATRELALALVSEVLAGAGADLTVRVRVLEGADQGLALGLESVDRAYTLGRAPQCDLSFADADVSREHAKVVRRAAAAPAGLPRSEVWITDLGGKNGTWLGEQRLERNQETRWRPTQAVRLGRTVLALEEPVADALARIEAAPDERLPATSDGDGSPEAAGGLGTAADPSSGGSPPAGSAGRDAEVALTSPVRSRRRSKLGRWSLTDRAVMAAAVGVLALSLVGLVWLLRT